MPGLRPASIIERKRLSTFARGRGAHCVAGDRRRRIVAATDAAAVTQATPLRKTASKVVSRPMFISWLALAFITTSSVASLRAAPSMAVFGLAAVFLYIVPAIMFLLPTSLVSAELASGWSGGHLRLGHGRHLAAGGFLAVWCQFALGPFSFLVKVSKDLGRPDGASSRPVYRTCLSGRRCSAKYWCRRSPVLLERPRDRCRRGRSWQRLLAVCCEHPWWVGCR